MLAIKIIITIILSIAVLSIIILIFTPGKELSYLDAQKVFSEGCLVYCEDIRTISSETGRSVEWVAYQKAIELSGSEFMNACKKLYPGASDLQCFSKNCCPFLPEIRR